MKPFRARHSPCALPYLLSAAACLFGPVAAAQSQPDADAESATAARPASEPADAEATVSDDQDAIAIDLEELRRQIAVLADEVEQLRSGETTEPVQEVDARALGLAPSAAATYRRSSGVSIAGYGEMLYENLDRKDESGTVAHGTSRLDFVRQILYAGYRFSDRFIFNSEIEIEHADEISVEFAYIDARVTDHLTVRAGMLLVPLGLVNEFHEPTVFIGARRPQTERRIIPTTWRENGVGVVGATDRFQYRAYVLNGLDATGFSADGLRGGRQKGSRAAASDLAAAGRLDVLPAPGILLGTGLYVGEADQSQLTLDGELLDVRSTVSEVHAQVQVRGFDVRALLAQAGVGNAARLNGARGLEDGRAVSERMRGGYVQVAYNLLSQTSSRWRLTPYYRYEQVDTQLDVPSGLVRDAARAGSFHTVGLEMRPHPQVVVKGDYERIRNDDATGRNQLNLGMGYAF